uniref:DNA repair protein complementing XP-C cells-like protein n=1 Tax=Noccaea caerulescens TaxID=107243 RepID=A0A1J3J9U5_NOCCA
MKPKSESKNGRLAAASREAVNKFLERRNARGSQGKKKQDDSAENCDSAKRDKGKYEKGKQATEEKLTDKDLEDRECSKSAGCDDDEMNDSDWEDCPIPSRDIAVDAYVDEARDFTIEFDHVPDTKRQKNAYRATAEDKERAELVHKVHLLCLLSRGRIVDNACNDPLIQASLVSLLPLYLSKVSNLENVTVRDIAPLLRWVRGNFSVRCTPSSEKSFRTSLAFALESRKGTAEELGALVVALLRALKLTARFVSILDVASLKPGADKNESSRQNRAKTKHGIFRNSTLMVPKQQTISSSPKKSSSHVKNKSLCETSEPQHGNPLGSNQLQDNMVNSSCEAGMSSKSDGTRRKGDVEFEMQLAMALTATADNQQSSKVNEKKKSPEISKTSDGLSVSNHVMSTAIGSKKVDSPLCWAEVYCSGENMDGKWVHVDAVNGMIDAEQTVEAAAAACKTLLRYVVAFAGGGAKDVTRRYCTKWHMISSKRVSSVWWDMVLAPLRELESATIGGSALSRHGEGYAQRNSSSLSPVANKACSSSSSFGIRSALEDMELATRALCEPLPSNQQAYKSHELYAIEKWLHKNQILHPKGPVVGYCSGHPVYPRTCVQTLKTKQRWLQDGLQLKANEVPLKILKRNSKIKRVKDFGDGDKVIEDRSQSMELYGKWQMEPLCLPHAVNGIVPKNERGQVDVWSEKCLPPGTVHIRIPRIFSVAKRFGIDYAPAMVGFEYRSGRATPVFEGIVVCTEFKDTILEAYAEEQEKREDEERRRNEAQAASRWYQLLLSILTRERLKNQYADNSKDVETRSLVAKTETVFKAENVKSPKKQGGVKRGRKSRSEGESHEHVFLDEQETCDEETSVKTKRCKCGFSVQVEQM